MAKSRARARQAGRTDRSYSSGSIPDAGSAPQGDRRAFLRVSDVPAGGAVVTFNGKSRVDRGSYGDQLVCEVRMGSKEYNWGMKIGGAAHRALQGASGRKIKPGLKLNVEPREFENDRGELIKFIAISED